MQYANNITNKRNILINKGWTISGDTVGSCVLSVSNIESAGNLSIYPNPTSYFIYIKNLKNTANYKISDESGRLLKEGKLVSEMVDISVLPKGNYLLQIITKDMAQTFKFIKK